jgi:hypothetical protein
MDWAAFTNGDLEDPPLPFSSLLPSSLSDLADVPPSSPRIRNLGPSSLPHHPSFTFEGKHEPNNHPVNSVLYEVQFHPNHSEHFHAPRGAQFAIGQFVLTDADRGVDVGWVTRVNAHPSARDIREAKKILRLATQGQMQQLPQKADREARALQLCLARVTESGWPMTVTAAEFQFDGKKLTFYFFSRCPSPRRKHSNI